VGGRRALKAQASKSLQLWQAAANKDNTFSQTYFGAGLMFGDEVQAQVA
jgi:hypothetical protein